MVTVSFRWIAAVASWRNSNSSARRLELSVLITRALCSIGLTARPAPAGFFTTYGLQKSGDWSTIIPAYGFLPTAFQEGLFVVTPHGLANEAL